MWYFADGMYGGTINDIAIHGVDIVRFITGLGEFMREINGDHVLLYDVHEVIRTSRDVLLIHAAANENVILRI